MMRSNRVIQFALYVCLVLAAFLVFSEGSLYYNANKRSWATHKNSNKRLTIPSLYDDSTTALHEGDGEEEDGFIKRYNSGVGLQRNRVEYPTSPKLQPIECCPSVVEPIQPKGGVSRHGRILELYHDSNSTQSFYQTSCREGVKGKQCNFVTSRLLQSRCVQKYTYTYALVREFGAPKTSPWRLDYIRIRGGCSCEVRRRPPSSEKVASARPVMSSPAQQ